MQSGSGRFFTWVLTGVLTITVVFFLNWAIDDVQVRIDLTEDGRYTLPAAAARIAASLDDTCRITVYLSEELPSHISYMRRALASRLEEFRQASKDRIEYEFVDPAKDPLLVEERDPFFRRAATG